MDIQILTAWLIEIRLSSPTNLSQAVDDLPLQRANVVSLSQLTSMWNNLWNLNKKWLNLATKQRANMGSLRHLFRVVRKQPSYLVKPCKS